RSADNRYGNAADVEQFLNRNKAEYVGGILEMCNARLYNFWGSLTEALRTGEPQNEVKTQPSDALFDTLYSDPERLKGFLKAMTGLSISTARVIAQKFPWQKYQTFIDIGSAQGALPVQIAKAHSQLTGGGFDLAPVRPIFEDYIAEHGLSERLKFYEGSFMTDPLPSADVLVMGHILHDWNLEEKKMLLQK